THNIAAFVALYHLLSAADTRGLRGIHVAGDNELTLRVLKTRASPKARRLQMWFLKCRRTADKVRVAPWTLLSKSGNAAASSL
ncbi:hypothetical protein PHYSODRAFT_407086, partial [Phytophthora sojae]